MLSVNILYIFGPDLFHVWYNNHDGSCSFISLTAEPNYDTARGCAYKIVQNRLNLIFLFPLMKTSHVFMQ